MWIPPNKIAIYRNTKAARGLFQEAFQSVWKLNDGEWVKNTRQFVPRIYARNLPTLTRFCSLLTHSLTPELINFSTCVGQKLGEDNYFASHPPLLWYNERKPINIMTLLLPLHPQSHTHYWNSCSAWDKEEKRNTVSFNATTIRNKAVGQVAVALAGAEWNLFERVKSCHCYWSFPFPPLTPTPPFIQLPIWGLGSFTRSFTLSGGLLLCSLGKQVIAHMLMALWQAGRQFCRAREWTSVDGVAVDDVVRLIGRFINSAGCCKLQFIFSHACAVNFRLISNSFRACGFPQPKLTARCHVHASKFAGRE